MKTKKLSLANIKSKMSRAEMKNIVAGSGGGGSTVPCPSGMFCDDNCPSQTNCRKELHLPYCACYTS